MVETYCVSYKKYTANENSNTRKTKQNRLMLLSNYDICGKKISTFTKNKEVNNFNDLFKMNKIDWRQIYAKMAFKTATIYLQCL